MKHLAIPGFVAVAVPFVTGIICAQTLPPSPTYTYGVVSIHPSGPGHQGSHIGPGPQGGLSTTNTSVMRLLTFAYDVRDYQFIGAPGWVSADPFDVSFTPDKAETTPGPNVAMKELQASMSRSRQRLQAVLRDRFGLLLRAETRELPVYALTQAKSGHKLSPSSLSGTGPSMQGGRGGSLTANNATIKMLTDELSSILERPVTDETGLSGQYNFKLTWNPQLMSLSEGPATGAGSSATGASLFSALTDQLGLKIESKKGPVTVYMIEKIQKPSQN
jgi:bla regulator protein blaR1